MKDGVERNPVSGNLGTNSLTMAALCKRGREKIRSRFSNKSN